MHSADVIETIRRAHLFGLKVDGFSVDFQKIVERVNNIVDSESNEMQTMRHSMLIIISCIPMTRSLSAMPQCHMQFLALLKSPE